MLVFLCQRVVRMNKSLRDIADIRLGYQFRGKVIPDPTAEVKVVQIKDIDADLKIRLHDLDSVNINRPEPYLIQSGDVLFLSRGHRLFAAVVPPVQQNTIATGYFFILRPKPELMLPEYLAWCLNQPNFQDSLKPFMRGTHIPMVSRTDVGALPLHVPPLTVQHQILAVNKLSEEEVRLFEKLRQKRHQLVHAILRKLIYDSTNTREDQQEPGS